MAIANLAAVAELIKEAFEEPFIDAMDRSNFLYERFGRRQMVNDKVEWKVHYAGNSSAGSYSEGDVIQTAVAQAYERAQIPVRQNWVTIEVTGLAQAATSSREGSFMNALATETTESLEDLINELETQMLQVGAKTDVTDIDSMDQIIADTGTYATIDRAVHTWFQSYELDNASVARPLSVALLQDISTEMEKPARKAKISIILCARKHWYDTGSLVEDRRRWSGNTVYQIDPGIEAIDWEGVPVVAVPALDPGAMYFLDERFWHYYVLEDFEVKPKDSNTDSDLFIITHYSALLCQHTGRQAVIRDLETS